MASFKKSFAAARKAGKSKFSWNGKSYTTELKKESNAPAKSKRPAARKAKGGPVKASPAKKATPAKATKASPSKASPVKAEKASKATSTTVKGRSRTRPKARSSSDKPKVIAARKAAAVKTATKNAPAKSKRPAKRDTMKTGLKLLSKLSRPGKK